MKENQMASASEEDESKDSSSKNGEKMDNEESEETTLASGLSQQSSSCLNLSLVASMSPLNVSTSFVATPRSSSRLSSILPRPSGQLSFEASTPVSCTRADLNQSSQTGVSSAARRRGRPPKPHQSIGTTRSFTNADRDGALAAELEVLCGVLIRMGVCQLSNVKHYWSQSLGVLSVQKAMSQNRFLFLMRNLHFCSNDISDEEKKADRAWKVRPLINWIRQNFLKIAPEECQAIDEQMVGFKGHSILRQFMPSKPIRFGFKVWARAGVSGFVYDFELYTGKASEESRKHFTTSRIGMGGQVVIDLLSSFPANFGHKIFADRFFTSYKLVQELNRLGYLFCGTVNYNRVLDAPLLPIKEFQNLDRDSTTEVVECKQNIVVVQWLDNRAVTMISNFVGVEPVDSCVRWNRSNYEHIDVLWSNIIQRYNEFMGGVDLNDMLRSMYSFSMKCRRWYIYIFLYLFNLAARNAWLLYRRYAAALKVSSIPLEKFLIELSDSMVRKAQSRKLPIKLAFSATPLPINNTHWPKHENKLWECKECRKRGERRRTCIVCEGCDAALCVSAERNCFKKYHQN